MVEIPKKKKKKKEKKTGRYEVMSAAPFSRTTDNVSVLRRNIDLTAENPYTSELL